MKKKFKCRFGFHNWTEWEQFIETGIYIPGRLSPKNIQGKEIPYTEKKQRRDCKECKYRQEESL